MNWHRTTVNLPPEYAPHVKKRAKEQNRNVTGYIKQLIDADFKKAGIKVAVPPKLRPLGGG